MSIIPLGILIVTSLCVYTSTIGNSWNWKLKMRTENGQNILIDAFFYKSHLQNKTTHGIQHLSAWVVLAKTRRINHDELNIIDFVIPSFLYLILNLKEIIIVYCSVWPSVAQYWIITTSYMWTLTLSFMSSQKSSCQGKSDSMLRHKKTKQELYIMTENT